MEQKIEGVSRMFQDKEIWLEQIIYECPIGGGFNPVENNPEVGYFPRSDQVKNDRWLLRSLRWMRWSFKDERKLRRIKAPK